MQKRTKAKAPETRDFLSEDFLRDFGMSPQEAQAAYERGHELRRLLAHAKAQATQALINEDQLMPDGYRLQGLIRGIDMIESIPSRIKELNDAPPQ